MATTVVSADGVHTYTTLENSDSGDAIKCSGLLGCVQALDGGADGFNAGIMSMEASNDGTNWGPLLDLQGVAITFTDGDEGKVKEFSTAAQYIRPTNDATVDDIDVIISLRA